MLVAAFLLHGPRVAAYSDEGCDSVAQLAGVMYDLAQKSESKDAYDAAIGRIVCQSKSINSEEKAGVVALSNGVWSLKGSISKSGVMSALYTECLSSGLELKDEDAPKIEAIGEIQ